MSLNISPPSSMDSNSSSAARPSAVATSASDSGDARNGRVSSQEIDKDSSIESQPSFNPKIMKEGYLQKKGQLLKGWKRRWFICDGRTISYYTSHKERKPSAVIPLDSCTVQDGGLSETWNSIRIYLMDGTTGTLYCLSAEEGKVVQEWLDVLKSAVARLQGSNGSNKQTPGVGDSAKYLNHSPRRAKESGFGGRKPSTATNNKQMPTNLKLENELTKAIETIEGIVKLKHGFQLYGVRDGVRMSIFRDKNDAKVYSKGSVIVNASPDTVAHIISDVSRRFEWDTHFPQGKSVASFGASTELVHLTGSCRLDQPILISCLPTPAVAAGTGLAAAAGSMAFGGDPMISSIVGAALGSVLSSTDLRSWFAERDLLVVKHIRDHADGSCLIVECSVVNELKPKQSGRVRAETKATGYLIQPLESAFENVGALQSLVTFVTDIDLKGWIPVAAKELVLMERLKNLANLREYVLQSNIFGEDLLDEEGAEVAADQGIGVGSSEFAGEASLDSEWNPKNWKDGVVHIPSGGLKITDKEIIKKQKGVLMDVLKSCGASILEGKSAVSLSLPVRIFEPRSMLERNVTLWLYAPTYLNRAVAAEDPVERMKLTIAFAIAGLHLYIAGQLKPFNPILGETYQTQLSDGTDVCCEHTSHHPPISNFQVLGEGYMLWGYFILGGGFKTNALTQSQKGPVYVDYGPEKGKIEYDMPYFRSGGFLFGDRVVEVLGTMTFKDKKNDLSCQIRFNPDEKKGVGGMFASTRTPSDYFRGSIIRTSTEEEICDASGSYLQDVRFGEKVYWDIDTAPVEPTKRIPTVLPSDCRFREDLRYLKQQDLEEAQEWKLKLEKLQRADRTLRAEGRRPNHWTHSAGGH